MYDFAAIEIASSGMSVSRARMGMLASNLANAHSTRRPDGPGPYLRKMVVARAQATPAFADMLEVLRGQGEIDDAGSARWLLEAHLRGVSVERIETDPATRQVHDPSHPDADPDTGMVTYPDISTVLEMTDMISAARNYEANLAVIKNSRDMLMQLIDMLKQ